MDGGGTGPSPAPPRKCCRFARARGAGANAAAAPRGGAGAGADSASRSPREAPTRSPPPPTASEGGKSIGGMRSRSRPAAERFVLSPSSSARPSPTEEARVVISIEERVANDRRVPVGIQRVALAIAAWILGELEIAVPHA